MDGWMLWLVLVGLAIGLFAAWLLLMRLPRDESDIDAVERRDEAAWIGHTIEYHGGVAPASLVEEVLDLHQAYLRDPSLRLTTQGEAALPAAAQPPRQPTAPLPPGAQSTYTPQPQRPPRSLQPPPVQQPPRRQRQSPPGQQPPAGQQPPGPPPARPPGP